MRAEQRYNQTLTMTSSGENWIVRNTVVKYSWAEFVRLTVATLTDIRSLLWAATIKKSQTQAENKNDETNTANSSSSIDAKSNSKRAKAKTLALYFHIILEEIDVWKCWYIKELAFAVAVALANNRPNSTEMSLVLLKLA